MRFQKLFAFLSLCLGILVSHAAAEEIKVGDPAPAFEAKDETGKIWKSSDVVGKKTLVIFFYPAATTNGCTKEACAYRDLAAKFTAKDTVVVGISGDKPEGQMLFKKLHNLNYPLLSDETGVIAKAFGVSTKAGGTVTAKDAKGETVLDKENNPVKLTRGLTESRWTFVIGKNGKILSKNTEVKAAEDAKQVLELIEKSK